MREGCHAVRYGGSCSSRQLHRHVAVALASQ